MEGSDEDEVFAKYYAAKKKFKKIKRNLSFNERISQMGGDNGRFSRKLNAETSFETYFEDAIDNWRGEDQGTDLESFLQSIQSNEIKTYAQVLHKAGKIFDAILEHLKRPECRSIPALCAILSALARDLRQKFGTYIWRAFEALINILDLGERIAENHEAAFLCLSVLVKVQSAYLSKQLKKTFTNFLPLFASSRDFARRFAAESYAYLLRKSSDLKTISLFIAQQAFKTKHNYLTDGCALLFHNTYIGIAGSFHSNCSQLFRDIVMSLTSAQHESEEFREFCTQVLIQMNGYTIEYAKKSTYDERYFYQHCLTTILGETTKMSEAISIMRILQPCFSDNNEQFLNEVNKKKLKKEKENKKNKGRNEFKTIENIVFEARDELKIALQKVADIEGFQLDQHVVDFISSSLLKIFNDDKNRLFSKDLTLKVVGKSKDHDIVIEFLMSMIDLESFDLYLMPALGKISEDLVKNKGNNEILIKKVISFYSFLCLQRRPIMDTLNRGSRNNFFDPSQHIAFRDWIVQSLNENIKTMEISTVIDMIVCWPWFFGQSEIVKGKDDVLKVLKEYMDKQEVSLLNSQVVYSATCGIYLTDKKLLKELDHKKMEEFISRQKCCESALLSFELFLDVHGISKDVSYFNRVVNCLFSSFLSPIDNVRRTSLRILKKFKLPLPVIVLEEGKKKQETCSAFEVMYEAENSELTNFRERLLHLRKLRFGQHKEFIPVGSNENVEKIILLEIFSQFFVNFTPLWKGVQEILTSYAHGMKIDEFWDVFSKWLDNVNHHIKHDDSENKIGRLTGIDTKSRSDYLNARIQIFDFLEIVPNIAERRTRILSPIILGIYEDFLRLTSTISDNDAPSGDIEDVGEEDEDDVENDKEVEQEDIENLPKRIEISHNVKALTSLLKVFSKFNAAKSTYLEPKLLAMYENLLTMKYENLQSAALACIFSYRNPILSNYRENLENLIDEKKLRQALPCFKLSNDENDAQVIDEHRAVVVPILLRILHGKLSVHVKQRGKVSRRNGIIYVIGGCHSDELSFFFKLFFKQIYQIFGSDFEFSTVQKKCEKEGVVASFNLRIFLRILEGVSEMLKKIARSFSENEQRMILKVTLTCGIVCKFAAKAGLSAENVKDLRMSVCDRIAEIFKAYPHRQLSKEEMTVIRDSIISTNLQNLAKNNIVERENCSLPVAPFSVVKLLSEICRSPSMYQILTVKIEWNCEEDSKINKCNALDLLLAPLFWPGCFDSMFRTIRGALLRLSELADEGHIEISNLVDCDELKKENKGINYGTLLLSRRIRLVLDFLTIQIEKEVSTTKRPASESITLLERFSDFVTESDDIPNRLATPLLMCIERKKCNEETLINMMRSLARMTPILKEPEQYFGRLPKLFSKMEGRTLRDALVAMVEGFVKSENVKNEDKQLMHLLCEMDAWDRTKVDEPHFDRRYAAYTETMKVWNSEQVVKPIIMGMFVCTHFHLISTTNDLSLRMTAGNNLRAIVEYSGRMLSGSERRLFLENYLSLNVVVFLKHENEAVREESLNTLLVMVKSFKDNQYLREIDEFSNQDEELDFLRNMNHIQIHRRQRALKRMVDAVEAGDKDISFNTMNKYLIPMIHPYLLNFTAKYNALSDESLRLMKLALSKAPWGKYCSYLETWLSKIEKAAQSPDEKFSEKALVRILVAVIEAFHFDVENVEQTSNENNEDGSGILDRISRVILPRLSKSLDSQAQVLERNARTIENQSTALHIDIQRAPIALAVVKLLQKLPEFVAKQHLHGVILKLINLMVTHSFDVRESARKTLIQIVKCLGPKYLSSIITEISLIMVKGFQVHVAIYSIHSMIVAMNDQMKPGDLDSAIGVIVKKCIQDQFHSASEEKEIGAIKAECPEAKGNRSSETLQYLGRFISSAGIQLVLSPFRDLVNEHPSAKSIQRVSDLLSKFATGLKENEGLDHSQLLAFIYKSLTTDLKKLADVELKNEQNVAVDNGRRPQSCLIIPTAPKRIGALNKVVIRSRDHVFAEFFVQLFGSLLKEKKLDISDESMISRLNPFAILILDCFDYKYEKLISCSLRALCSMIAMRLPAISSNFQRVSDTLFVLLSDYSAIGQAGNKPAIIQLNQMIYKGFTNLISTSGADFLDNEKLTLLLAYAESDVMDQHKQSTMFSLIKAIIKNGVRHERLPEIMDHLSETAIRSPLVNIRAQCRETLVDYIGGASDSEKSVEKFIGFFLDQLDYEYETGRQSAAEMLNSLFRNLLAKTLEPIHMLCVVKLGAAMMNEESEKVCVQIRLALRHLLETVGVSQRQETFEVICQWLATEDENARAVGIQTAVQLSYVEKTNMVEKVGEIVKKMKTCLFDEDVFENNSESTIVAYLSGLTRIMVNCGKDVVAKFDAVEFINSLGDLCKCDESIRIMHSASVLLGEILSLLEESESLTKVGQEMAKELCSWMTRCLRHEKMDTPCGEQASKNLVCLTKLVDFDAYQVILANIASACRYEIKHQVKSTLKRVNCFKLVAALFVTGDEQRQSIILDTFMTIFVRELRTSQNEELSDLTHEVCNLIKRKIGDEEYGTRVAECQKIASEKINDRKRKIKELAVTAPEDAAELRRKKNKKKTETRKRKLDVLKPYRLTKRRNAEKRKAMQNECD